MTLAVFAALLAAAILHAGWNALVRRDSDRDAAALAVAAGGAAVGLVLAPFLPPISAAAIPYGVASSCCHVAYYALVARAYQHGELSLVYPVMRGLAPLIVAIVSVIFVEPAPFAVFAGVVVLAAGIASLGLEGLRRSPSGLAAALTNAAVIAAYTIVDGLGARASGSPGAYTAWILVGGGLATVGFRLVYTGRTILRPMAARYGLGLVGALMSFGAYAIALWAMTVAPIGAVAAIRESAVLFATVIGAVVLRERFGVWRWVASALVVGGLALVKLGGS